jgi:hypothetical protein
VKNVLLITATISPPAGAVNLSRLDPALRLKDYLTAFGFYVNCLDRGYFDRLVFCENSGSDISALKEIADNSRNSSKIEFLVFDGMQYPPQYGRGYGELKLIEFAMKQSTVIESAPSECLVWKVTGRYIIKNLRNLIPVSGADFSILYCNCKNYPTRWVDMYFMGWRVGSYGLIFNGAAERVVESEIIPSAEIGFRGVVDALSLENKVNHRFAEPAIIEGIRGFDGAAYESKFFRYTARKLLGRIAPWFWI